MRRPQPLMRLRGTSEMGLLIGGVGEGQRTNLALRSQEFDNASWTKNNGTISANAVTAPDGATTADKFVEAATNTNHYVVQNITYVNGTTYTFSVFLKAAGRDYAGINIDEADFGSGAIVKFNLATGTIDAAIVGYGSGYSAVSATITSVGNSWYRCTITVTAGADTAGDIIVAPLSGSGGTSTYVGDGSSGIYIWGAQVEAGSFASSPITTTSATVTRPA